jgi:hypothetical protein
MRASSPPVRDDPMRAFDAGQVSTGATTTEV